MAFGAHRLIAWLFVALAASASSAADFTISNLPPRTADSYRVEVVDVPLPDFFRHVFRLDGTAAQFPRPIFISDRVRDRRLSLLFSGGDFAALLAAIKAGFDASGNGGVCVIHSLDAVVFDICDTQYRASPPLAAETPEAQQ